MVGCCISTDNFCVEMNLGPCLNLNQYFKILFLGGHRFPHPAFVPLSLNRSDKIYSKVTFFPPPPSHLVSTRISIFQTVSAIILVLSRSSHPSPSASVPMVPPAGSRHRPAAQARVQCLDLPKIYFRFLFCDNHILKVKMQRKCSYV